MKLNTLISNPLLYFIRIKNLKKITPIKLFKLLRNAIIIFDHNYFIQTGKSKSSIVTAYTHFILKGLWTGNRVHEHFDPMQYSNSYPKSPMKTSLPLLHYIAKSSGSNPITPFDRAYLSINPTLKNFEQALLVHFAKFNSTSEKFVVPDTFPINRNRYEINVSLVNVNPRKIYDFNLINLHVSCGSPIFISDTDTFENKILLVVKTSTTLIQHIHSSVPDVLVETFLNNGQLFINIHFNKEVLLDIRWLRILVFQNQFVNESFDAFELSNTLEFLLNSISNRLPADFEIMGPEFSFSISGNKKYSQDFSLSKVHFKTSSFREKGGEINDDRLILLISHEDSYSGAPLYLLQIATQLKYLGFQVAVICLRPKYRSGVFTSAGFQTYYLEDFDQVTVFKKEWILNDRGQEFIRSLFLELEPEQIWVNSIACSSVVGIAVDLNFPVCFFVHESYGFNNQNYHVNDYEIIFHSALEKSHLVVFGSENSKTRFKRNDLYSNGIVLNSVKVMDKSQLCIEPDNSFRVRKELGIEQMARVYLSMANFEPRKRISDIVLAFKEANITESFLVLIGSLKDDPYSEKIARECHNSSNILVLPTVSNPAVYYELADVLILASEEETYPIVLQEATHWDLLRIVSRFPGYEESCDDGDSLLFNVGDVSGLSELIHKGRLDTTESIKLRKNARSKLTQKEIIYKKELHKIIHNLSYININFGEKI
jgi:glycosyltransferase involved in cell wall biosynthesis